MITKLKDSSSQRKEMEIETYDKEGRKMVWPKVNEKMKNYWKTIYNKQPNQIKEEWNEQIKVEYKEEIKKKDRNPIMIYSQDTIGLED